MVKKYTFAEYQKESRKTAVYPKVGQPIVYPVLGLVGEAGEVAEKVKKVFRDHNGKIDAEQKELIEKELGDVLWYLAQISFELGSSLENVAKANIKKLRSRLSRDKIHGNGDNR
ncbi:MAG TPA: nucleoside triphosphate pyrophosphohydrolase family protein [Candidatus Paceibacterota bacterium]|nr:nucleoside triphosphate pyrophosphohydrolase family protein [Candidatus Paceibacterota bacterium]